MSYQEFRELYVICDECHTRLFVYDATDEDADNEAADSGAPDELEAAGWHIDRDYPDDSLCPNHHHLSCRECRKWDVGPLHRLEYEGWQLNSTDPNDSLCPECVKAKEETK